MKTLVKILEQQLPFAWLDPIYLPNSKCLRKEIYLKYEMDLRQELTIAFDDLFGKLKDKLIIGNGHWGDFCLDTWVPPNEYSYRLEGKSNETKAYLTLLSDSNIEPDYSGLCRCNDWDKFLATILVCLLNHQAPYSPLFYCLEYGFVFYFHHTGSIGLLYLAENNPLKELFAKANKAQYVLQDL